jgi:hypothetical protein
MSPHYNGQKILHLLQFSIFRLTPFHFKIVEPTVRGIVPKTPLSFFVRQRANPVIQELGRGALTWDTAGHRHCHQHQPSVNNGEALDAEKEKDQTLMISKDTGTIAPLAGKTMDDGGKYVCHPTRR